MNVAAEIAALHRMRARHLNGAPMGLYCWGLDYQEHGSIFSQSFYFDIRFSDQPGRLDLSVDTYSQAVPADSWDVDAWVRAEICLNGPASRDGVRALSQAARSLLGGRCVKLTNKAVVCPFVTCSPPAEAITISVIPQRLHGASRGAA